MVCNSLCEIRLSGMVASLQLIEQNLNKKPSLRLSPHFHFYSPFLKVITTVENLVIGSLHEDCKNSVTRLPVTTLHFLKKTYNLKKL